VVGNMRDRGNWSLEPNLEVRQQNMDAAIQFCAAMRPALRRGQLTKSSRPSRAPSLGEFSGAES